MSEKSEIEVGETVKIERRNNGWVVTVAGLNNSSHRGKPYLAHSTFDEAIAYIKQAFTVDHDSL